MKFCLWFFLIALPLITAQAVEQDALLTDQTLWSSDSL